MQSKVRGLQYSLLAVAVGLVALGAVQGARLDRMREIERFYRWALTAATFSTFGETLEHEKTGNVEPMDDELFADVVALAESSLPDSIEVGEGDLDAKGQPRSKLARAARQGLDKDIYRVLASREGAPLAARFTEYLAEKRLVSVGTQFAASEMYQKGSQAEGVGITSLFFGFRKLAANFLWMQVDGAWHSGQMHRFLPMMRTTVALDPNFVDAYLLGAWHLAYNITARLSDTPEPQKVFNVKYKRRLGPKEEWYYVAADFLKDGIRKNPRDFRLYSDLGYAVYETKLRDHSNAVRYLKEARRYKHDQWVPRMLCLSLWRNGQYDEALEGWQEYLKQFPNSTQAARFIPINTAYLAEAKSDQAAECAKAARAAAAGFTAKAAESHSKGDGATAEKLLAQADDAEKTAQQMDQMSADEWRKAKDIYTAILSKVENDVIASSRLLRRTALDLAREGRYTEAVGYLDVARNQYLEAFDEYSDMMIDLKLEGGLPLAVTEQYAIERRREAAAYAQPDAPKPRRFVECAYALPEQADAIAASTAAGAPH
jgi:outer membrane protein assembly factor BamD (BamD/ComL family)